MKNMSVRTRILATVVIVNLLGAMAVVVYLHQSYSKSIDSTAAEAGVESLAAWEQIKGEDAAVDPIADPAEVQRILEGMKAVTGDEYGFLLDKLVTDEDTYAAARETLGESSAWAERENYALLFATDAAAADKMQFERPATEVSENSQAIGVEIGSCTKTCHEGMTGEGDFWTIKWSTDSSSKGHAVFPVYGADDEALGVVYVIEDVSAQADGANRSMLSTLAVVGVTLLVSTLVIGMMMDLLVLRRLRRMTESMQDISMRVAGGDFSAEFVSDGTNDEIGSFEKFFSDFIHVVSTTLKQLSGS